MSTFGALTFELGASEILILSQDEDANEDDDDDGDDR